MNPARLAILDAIVCVVDGFGGGSSAGGVDLTDRIGIGVLARLVPRELVDEVIVEAGRREQRKRLLPARVVVYFVMGLALFQQDAYEEVMRKLVHGLQWLRIWRSEWSVPTTGALTQARKRLGAQVMRDLFERVAAPCARRSTEGAWLHGWRLMALDGFDVEVPDSEENAQRFGYAGKKKNEKGAFPKVTVVALAECGTHAITGAELGTQSDSETGLATRLLSSGAISSDMLVIGDRGLYTHEHMRQVVEAGADVLFRAKAGMNLPALKWFQDGSYLSYSPESHAGRSASRRRYPQFGFSRISRSTRARMERTVGGRPGRFGLDRAAWWRRMRSRCQRSTVSGRTSSCIRYSASGVRRCSSAARNARSGAVNHTFRPPGWRSSTVS